jgi:type II secretory pathway component GspD/PulD (secretin)
MASIWAQDPGSDSKVFNQGKGKGGKGGGGKGFGPLPTHPLVQTNNRWEYLVRTSDKSPGSEIEAELNKLGSEGWELVQIMSGTLQWEYYFKRAKIGASASEPAGTFGPMRWTRVIPPEQQKELTQILTPQHAPVMHLAQLLSNIYGRTPARFVPDNSSGRLIVVAPKDKLAEIESMIQQLDQPATQVKMKMTTPALIK